MLSFHSQCRLMQLPTGRLSITLSAVALLTGAGQPPPSAEQTHTDSASAHLSTASYVFECGGTRTTVGFEERVQGDAPGVPIADRWRIRLTSFAVDGRHIGESDLRRVQQAFHHYAWLVRLRGRCSPSNRDVNLWVEGIHARDWASFTESDDRPRPRIRAMEVSVRADGSVAIR